MNAGSGVNDGQVVQPNAAGGAQSGLNRPGGEIAKRRLHIIFLCDVSGSMASDGKIQSLNAAIQDAIAPMQRVAAQNPQAEVLVRALAFNDDVTWLIEDPVAIADVKWTPMSAEGSTAMGKALSTVASVLNIPPMDGRGFQPAVILVSDGQPTDDFDAGLKDFMAAPWGQKAIRLAIGIGKDADHRVLEAFIGNPEIPVLQANNPEKLTRFFRFASTLAIQRSSQPTKSGPVNACIAAANAPVTAVNTGSAQVW